MVNVYTVGQKINTRYINGPLPKDEQYKIGQTVSIIHTEHGELATFIVDRTDAMNVSGTVNWVNTEVYNSLSGRKI